MAEAEESSAARQARIRREKREAKIKAQGSERLDKITKLSGRTPEMMRNESPIRPATPQSPPQAPTPPTLANTADPTQAQAQQEYLRTLLRAQPPGPQQSEGQGQEQEPEDPMMKMMNQLMGGLGQGDGAGEGGLPFSPEELSKATGLPSFVTDMFLGKQKTPPTPAQIQTARIWKIVHTVFALIASAYAVFTVSRSRSIFGEKPPAPATIQNPFLAFTMGELLIQGSKMVSARPAAKPGFALWLQLLKDLAADGLIVVFALGCWSWWNGLT